MLLQIVLRSFYIHARHIHWPMHVTPLYFKGEKKIGIYIQPVNIIVGQYETRIDRY